MKGVGSERKSEREGGWVLLLEGGYCIGRDGLVSIPFLFRVKYAMPALLTQ